jgi:nuclear GTP-binding protein
MGNAKKEVNRKKAEGKSGDGMGNVKVKGEDFRLNLTKLID